MVLDESMKKVLSDLIRKRGVIKASLTRIVNFVNKFDPHEQAISLLEFRQEELPQINRKFDAIQSEIELLTTDNAEGAENERDKFEADYFELRSRIQEFINAEKPPSTIGPNASFGNTSFVNRTQLAPIPLPNFNGNIQDWTSFFDVFRAMVHENDTLSDAQKFFYLRSCLSGQALDLVRSIPVSDSNYEVVVQRLKQRYDNKSIVIQSHIRALLDSPRVEEQSATAVHKLHSHVCTHVAALKAMGQPIEHWDAWLITIITSRLDKDTGHGWQLHQRNTDLPRYEQLEQFLTNRCVALESSELCDQRMEGDTINDSSMNVKKSKFVASKKSLFVSENVEPPCICCKEFHKLYTCDQFKKLSVNERLSKVREAQRCFNCLSPHHGVSSCKSKFTCHHCKKRHNTLLHFEKVKQQVATDNVTNPEQQDMSTAQTALWVAQKGSHVFLATAVVSIADHHGIKRKCRAVLDSGSQINFISKRLANLLKHPREQTNLPIRGIGASRVNAVTSIKLKIESRVKQFDIDLTCHVLPTIVDDFPVCPNSLQKWEIPDEFIAQLADPSFCSAGTVDLLIGGGAFFDLLEPERIPLGTGSLCLQGTKLGWIVTGEIGAQCLLNINSMGQSLEEGWMVLENNRKDDYGRLSKTNKKTYEELESLKHFHETATRNSDGRFVLRLPLNSNMESLGDTREMAISRFLNVERRLQRDKTLKDAYVMFMEEYKNAGHMYEVTNETIPLKKPFYLPHHPVLKSSSLTTKLRVVFDASAKSTTGVALNDVLMCGPTVQEELFSILVRFRRHQYVITADVEKMFRQISVAIEDQDLQRIVWRADPSDIIRSYRLATVTYGTTPASFMATQCLVSLAETEKHRYPNASIAIRRDFYMDDLLTGAETIEECILLQTQISDILDSARFPLRKWCSNSSNILANVDGVNKEPLYVIQTEADDVVKSLGLYWKPTQDNLGFQIVATPKRSIITKRMLLSDLNKVFDPLGFLTPVLIKGKIFLQQLWQIKVEWDKPLPDEIKKKWELFHQQLERLTLLSIPRKCKPCSSEQMEVHGFSDASQEAYGACIYVRCKDNKGQWHAHLLCSKSRVAPIKGATIPRLELGGALVLTQLAVKVAAAWGLEIKDFHFWTDSMVLLGWLNSQTIRLKTYVANRIEQILEVTTPLQWRHVKTDENPADILSRGISAEEIQNSTLWWKGPQWLTEEQSYWEWLDSAPIEERDLPEQRTIKLVLTCTEAPKNLVNIYSDWPKLVRAIAWLSKFIEYRREQQPQRITRQLTVTDLRNAERILTLRAQNDAFHEEIGALIKGLEVSKRSSLRSLRPVLQNGLILVGGRLQNANINETQKHPVILPYGHKITRLIFENHHRMMLHCGPQSLLASIRRCYWPIKGRVIARSTVAKCVTCTRAKPRFETPLMAPMPRHRVQPTRPFTITGVDFAGPMIIRSGVRRSPGKKAWIAVFVCFATRAIHLEAVEDLTSAAFIASLRRFMARRGRCSTIYSDNGTNFVGAKKELAIYIKNADKIVAQDGITWHFNPPSSPHFGGLWESAVKGAKHHLTRVVKDTKLTLLELITLLCQIEACLNSRPITPLSSDPTDIEPLTPAHFLIGGPMFLQDETDLTSEQPNGLKRWKYVQYLMQTFWSRWHREYLPQLQTRGKWTTMRKNLRVDDLVIIKDDNNPPAKWKLGRVKELHTGHDGIVRVVTLQTGNKNEIRRPVVKLCRIPLEGEDVEES